MNADLKTLAAWAKELGVNEKKLKEAANALGLEPEAKKGACAYYGRDAAQKAAQAIH